MEKIAAGWEREQWGITFKFVCTAGNWDSCCWGNRVHW